MRVLILILLFFTQSILAKDSNPCHPDSILSQVMSMKLEGKKIIAKPIWIKFPTPFNPNSGDILNLKFNAGDTLLIEYKIQKSTKTLKVPLTQKRAEIEFSKWFEENAFYNQGELILSLYEKQKKICHFSLDLKNENK